MSGLRVGELCAGYGGLGMGVGQVLDCEMAWYSEIDKGALKVLEHRFPGVPNIGDMTTVDWATVPPVDILTGGTPCQDLSHAGKRAGMTEGTRSNLWVAMREAIAVLKPRLVVWENVEGAASAEADSDMEPCAGCVGDARDRGPVLRALGRVVGDLASLGYVGCVGTLRAADVGAPHGRRRRFLAAHPASDPWRVEHRDGAALADDHRRGRSRIGRQSADHRDTWDDADGRRGAPLLPSPRTSDTNGAGAHGDGGLDLRTAVAMLPTPRATDGTKGGPNQRGSSGDLMLPSAVTLLPTPAVNDMGAAYTPETWDAWTERMKAEHDNGNGHGKSLNIEAQRLLPTLTVTDARASGGNPQTTGTHGTTLTDATIRRPDRWGEYTEAITRWESLTRPAPPPTMVSGAYLARVARRKSHADKRPVGMRGSLGYLGRHQLAPAFSEFMMGLPAGWVTDTPGITRNEALRALGNGVVPQQAAAAVAQLLAHLDGEPTHDRERQETR